MPGTVTVGCKLPNGLILRLFTMYEEDRPIQGGGMRTVKEARNYGDKVYIQGNMAPHGKALLDQFGEPITVYSGFATTQNVDADFWDQWYEQNKQSDVVKNGLIFAHAKALDVRAEAKEKEKVKSGLERMDGAEDPRAGIHRQRMAGGSISAVQKDDGAR